MDDLDLLLLLGPLVLIVAIVCEVAWRNRYVPQWLARKVLHIIAIGTCAVVPLWLQDLALLRWIVIFSEIILIWLVLSGRLFDQDGARSWGILFFPLPYLILLFVETDRWSIALPMLILAVADALAAVMGIMFSMRYFRFTGDPKSLIGSGTFFSITLILLFTFTSLEGSSFSDRIFLLIAISLMLTAIEALGSRGGDNFLIPLAAWALFGQIHEISSDQLSVFSIEVSIGCIGAFLFSAIAVRMKWLTIGGAIAASLIGVWVIFFAGGLWLLPLFIFLIGSTLIGKLNSSDRISDPKHGRPRDAIQVICNGGIYAASAAIFDQPQAAIAMAASIAISTADTWASETGMFFRGRTIDIANWKPVPPGVSGGISIAGTAGAVAGSIALALVCIAIIDPSAHRTLLLLLITIGGITGMLLDSFLGSKFQVRYRSAEGSLSDVRTAGSRKVSGFGWMTNDMVNIISNILVTAAILLLFAHLHSGE